MTGILQQMMGTMEQTRTMSTLDSVSMIGFAALLVLGAINCILGYRLLRFWMMLFGFLIGGGLGLGAAYTMGIQQKYMYAVSMIGVGILLAVIAFLSYKVGIFIIGAGIGLGLGIYVFHPTTSLMFFFCILLGVGLGTLAMKWAREVLIVGTSLLGGVMAGFSLAKLGGLEDIPYGVGLSVGCALLGMLIQFATNRRVVIEEEEYDPEVYEKARRSSDYMETEDYLPRKKRTVQENAERNSGRKKAVDVRIEKPRQRRAVDIQLESPQKHPQKKRNTDVPVQRTKVRKHNLDAPAPEREETVVYRPKRAGQSVSRDDGNAGKAGRDDYEDSYYDDDYYDEPIDEELLDEQVIQEMMDDDDREGEEIWNRISRKSAKKNTKRSKNAR